MYEALRWLLAAECDLKILQPSGGVLGVQQHGMQQKLIAVLKDRDLHIIGSGGAKGGGVIQCLGDQLGHKLGGIVEREALQN